MKNFLFILFSAAALLGCKDKKDDTIVPEPPLSNPCPSEGSPFEINGDWEVTDYSNSDSPPLFSVLDVEFAGSSFAIISREDQFLLRLNLDNFATERFSSDICNAAIVSAPDENNVFVFTDIYIPILCDITKNELFHSSDGGTTWETLPLPESYIVYDAHFVNSQKGFAIINEGLETHLWSSLDGGETWARHDSLTATDTRLYKSIHFVNDEIGFVLGDGFNIYKTVNGGGNWERLTRTVENLHSIQMIDEMVGFAKSFRIQSNIFEDGNLYKTSNGGQTWTMIFEGEIISYHFVDDKYGILFLYPSICEHQNGDINALAITKITSDGGITWQDGAWHFNGIGSSMYFWSPTEGIRFGASKTYKLEYLP